MYTSVALNIIFYIFIKINSCSLVSLKLENDWTDLPNFGLKLLFVDVQEKFKRRPNYPFPNVPNTRFPNLTWIPNPRKAGNALVTPLEFQVSMGGGDCLPSDEPSALLPAYSIKKNVLKGCKF
uniref:SFRICE_030858 n=1 Tax=Spodoptera frugiperda TaxID=7108 RepID=A0A2H1VVQ2_SPOFR